MGEAERKREDLCYKKASFEVLETFVCFLLHHQSQRLVLQHARSLLLFPSLSPFFPPPFFSQTLLLCSRMHLCQRWKALHLLQTLWCLNGNVKSKLFSEIPSLQSSFVTLQIPGVASVFFTLSPQTGRHGKICPTYQTVYQRACFFNLCLIRLCFPFIMVLLKQVDWTGF